jgi:hypothetical protein
VKTLKKATKKAASTDGKLYGRFNPSAKEHNGQQPGINADPLVNVFTLGIKIV